MSDPAVRVICGQVVTAVGPSGWDTVEAVAIRGGRVVAAGYRDAVTEAAGVGALVEDFGTAAVVPGLHDFHLHLVGMARLRREVRLDDVADGSELVARLRTAAAGPLAGGWLRGRGWHERVLGSLAPEELAGAAGSLPALVYSHDAHSAWASPPALAEAGIVAATPDPPGGRIERDERGEPTGVLRERATDLVERVAGRLEGAELDAALDEVVPELLALGLTGATDAGDPSADNGTGGWAALGDRASRLLAAGPRLDGRLRVTVNLPAAAIAEAAGLGLRTGRAVPGTRTITAGWAKAYMDGALGSRTAATFDPYTCGEAGDRGLPRLSTDELDAILRAGREHGVALAVHAIGDRAAALVLDALERAPRRDPATPPDRIEHLQLMRPADHGRLAALDVTASLQPVHCASDRTLVEDCWAGRERLAYPWRDLVAAGARLAFGSDAPIETVNPWLGMFAAVHRRFPGDGTPDWQPQQALTPPEALAAYTRGPALAAGRDDLGHLRPGARGDLAVLNIDLPTLQAADERLAEVRSLLTLVEGREVHRG
ncbi:MAG TPA: amidohydrolase [candidate division Zixibacteria bacterium]|nr:amidohydrolase [candidate division Zixibacteria bacterium]